MVDRVVWGLVAVATVYSGALIVSARSTGSVRRTSDGTAIRALQEAEQ